MHLQKASVYRVSMAAGLLLALSFVQASVSEAQYMLLAGGAVDLYVDGSTTVRGQSVASDASTVLQWGGWQRPKKITVETSAPGQVYTLRAVLVGAVGRATPQPEVTLLDGMSPQDFVRDIRNRQDGHGLIRYTASVTPEQGAGQDTHVVTFTLTDQ